MPLHRWIMAAAGLWLGGLLASVPAAPSRSTPPGSSYSIDWWETDDGLPQNSVLSITQTRDGYLWLGTLNGLVRFDGLRFTVFDESNTPGLGSSRIIHLFEDSARNLWVGTETAGIALVRDGEVAGTSIGRGSRDGRLVSACEDATGAVWFYTADGQLWRSRQGTTNAYSFEADRFSVDSASNFRAVIAEESGLIWVGTDTRLAAFNPQKVQPKVELTIEQRAPVGRLDFLLASQHGGYWRLADGRVQKWGTNQLEKSWGYPANFTRGVSSACEDQQGNLIVGTLGAGLFWFEADGRVTNLSTNEGLSHSWVLSLHADREGSLWVGTDGGGLNRIKRQVFDVLASSRGLVVQSACEDEEETLWFGSNGGGVGRWKDGVAQHFGVNQGLDPSVKAVLAEGRNRVWAGTSGAGLFQWQGGESFHRVFGMNQPVVFALHKDRAQRLWVGTGGGLACWDGTEWKLYRTPEGLSADEVRALADDGAGGLWIGTRGGGLNRWSDGKFTAFRKKDGLPSDDISSLYLDEAGALWIGTFGSGLGRYHHGRWTRYTTREGLVSNSVGYLVEDAQGYLWIGSNQGLMRVKKMALDYFAEGRTTFVPGRVFGKPDGLPTVECTLGFQPGACRTKAGRIWFPTIKGLASVHPAQIHPNTNPPPVMIESVWIEGEAQHTNALRTRWPHALIVPPGKEHLEIRFTSLNLAAPDMARFKYRLEGHESGWTEVGNTRVVHYSKLPAGNYLFRVTACNEDGLWNSEGSTLALTVEPPFWRTWWFLTGASVLLLGFIVGGVYYVATQKLQRQLENLRQQEALEKERARIARDIHDQVGASLTQVSLLGELVASDKDFPAEVEAHARQITQTARETTHALDEIVWTVNPSNDTLEGLINYICKYAQDYLAVAGVSYRLDVPTQLPAVAIPPDLRHHVFLAAKEAVTNVVRHAKASSVWIRLRLERDRFELEIQDDGRGPAGMKEKRAESRNGLRNMGRRMEDVGGAFHIGPAPERGTLVRLTAPIHNR